MAAASLRFAAQAGATPVPMPGGPTGSGSSPSIGIDFGPLQDALLDALKPENLFKNLVLFIAEQLSDALHQLFKNVWHSGPNVFTYTDPGLTYGFGPVADLIGGVRLLIVAITALALVLAAVALAGREVFGWGEALGEHLGRIGLAAVLANGASWLTQRAIDLNNQLCWAIGSTVTVPGFDRTAMTIELPAMLLGLALAWFGLQLAFKMLYRVGILWVLLITAPMALACWAIPQAQWVASTWTRQFVGWTFGQVLVVIALKLGFAVSPLGPSGYSEAGIVFGIVTLALAVDLVDLLVHGSLPRYGPIRGAHLVLRFALMARSIAGRAAPRPAASRA